MTASKKPLLELRKNPVQARSRATVEVILDAAAQVLEADPQAGTNPIAARAGFSIGTLYQYFPNRDAILAAIAAREERRVLAGIEAAMGDFDFDAPEDALRAALRYLLRAFGQRRTLRRKVLMTLLPLLPDGPRGEIADRVVGDILDRLRARRPDRIRALDATGRFVLTRSVMGVVRAAVVEGGIDLRDAALEDELLRLVLSYARNAGQDGTAG